MDLKNKPLLIEIRYAIISGVIFVSIIARRSFLPLSCRTPRKKTKIQGFEHWILIRF